MFRKTEKRRIESFVDDDWAGAEDDRRSTTRYCTKVWDSLVTWRNKKQSTCSSAEAEFRALAQGVRELIWLKEFMIDLKIPYSSPMKF